MRTFQAFREDRRPIIFSALLLVSVLSAHKQWAQTGSKLALLPVTQTQNLRLEETRASDASLAAVNDTVQVLAPDEIEKEYAVARQAFRSRDWVKALVALEMIAVSRPDYRDVNEMVVAARRGLEQDSTEALVGRHYVEGLKAKRSGDFSRARQAFRAAIALQPDFRDVAAQLAEVEAALRQPPKAEAAPVKVIELPLDSLHEAARAASKRGAWQEAVALFSQLEELDPENQELRKQAERARISFMIAQTGLARVEAAGNKRRMLTLALAALGMLAALAIIGFAFSSRGRAEYFIRRRKYRRAEQVYESMLQRAPNRLKAYPLLAQLYLRSGRTDSAALKVFRLVLDLNLRTTERERLAAIVESNARPQIKESEPATETLDFIVQDEHKIAEEKSKLDRQAAE